MNLVKTPESISTINPNTLLLGDCLTVMQNIPADSIDAIICDLPYGTTRCKWDVTLPFADLWHEYRRVLRPHGNVVLFGAQPFTTEVINSNRANFRYCLYWRKDKGTGFLNAAHQPLRIIEEISVFNFGKQATYNPQMIPLERPRKRALPRRRSLAIDHGRVASMATEEAIVIEYTHQHPTTLIECGRDGGNVGLIATQKPLALMEHLVATYSNPDDVVLDNTMGTGTTGVACVNRGRRFIGIELDPHHFEIASRRIDVTAWLEWSR